MRAINGFAGARTPVVGLVLLGAVLAGFLPACRKSSSRAAAPPPVFAGEFIAWQSLGGGHSTRAMEIGDLDGDTDLDVFEVNYGEQNRLLLNDGSAELTDGTDLNAQATTGLPAESALSRCAVIVDVDGDGDMDIVVGNNGRNALLINNGSGEFTDGTDIAGVRNTGLPSAVDDTWALAVIDADGDSDSDLIVGNTGQNQLLLNDGNGEFFVGTDLAATLTTGLPAVSDATRGLRIADIDSDTDLDIVVANDQGAQDRILLNSNGVGEFIDGTFAATTGLPLLADNSRAVVVSPATGGFDAQTGLDLLFVGQGVPRLLVNDGGGFFTDASSDWSREVPGQTANWRGLYVLNATNLFAVGDSGTIRFSNGSGAWGLQSSGVTDNLYGVHGTATNNVYAVGDNATIINWNSTVWSSPHTNPAQASAPYPGDHLRGVAVVPFTGSGGGTEHWAVGTNAMLLKSTDGTSWSQVINTDNPVYTPAVTGPPYVAPTGPTLHAVTGFDAGGGGTDTIMYAVGDSGTILRKGDGVTAWTQLTSNTTRHLYAIFGTSATNLWAVGEGGTILYSADGTTWTLQPSGSNRDLFSVYGADASNLWVAGRAGEVLVTINGGTAWTTDNCGTHADIYALGGTSTTNVYGLGLVATIVHETGATSTMGMPAAFLEAWDAETFDVNGDGDDDVVIAAEGQNFVYLNTNGNEGNFTDGSVAALTTRPSNDSRGVSRGLLDGGGVFELLWANTGQNRLDMGQSGGTFNDGTDTASATTTGLPTWFDARDGAAGDVTGDGVHDLILAVSGGQNRLYIRQAFGFVDNTSTRMPADTDPSEGVVLVDVDGDGDLDLVFANNGVQNRLYLNNGAGIFTDATATQLPVDTDASVDVTFADVDNQNRVDLVFANMGSQNKLYTNDGTGTFTDVTVTNLPVDTDPSHDVVLADVDNDGDRDLITSNGARWAQDTSGVTDNLYGVSAAGASDIWAVGANGRALRWNGTTWASTTTGVAVTLRSVYAITQYDVVAVGDSATIVRWTDPDGSGPLTGSWSTEAAPASIGTANLLSVHGTGAADLHAVGAGGVLIRNTGSTWTQIATGVTPAQLNGVYSVAGPFAVAVGSGAAPLAVVWNGTYWATLNPPGSPTLNAVAGAQGSEAYAVGTTGTILRFRGIGWSTIASGVTVPLNGIDANSVGGLLAVGGSGTATRDTGQGFVPETVLPGGSPPALNAVVWVSTAHAVTVGDGGTIAQWHGAQNRLATNSGTGVFTDVTGASLPVDLDVTTDGTLADVDLDNDLDIYFANALGQGRLYINNGIGSGNFSDGTDLTQVASTGIEPEFDDTRAAIFLSARNTQWDLIVAVARGQNRLLLNGGGGEFADSTDEGNANSFGLVTDRALTHSVKGGDFNIDGKVDVIFINAGGAVILLHQ